jgi:hypothetical protein
MKRAKRSSALFLHRRRNRLFRRHLNTSHADLLIHFLEVWMFKRNLVLVLSFAIILSGCATAERSTWLGAGIGASLGAGFGVLAGGPDDGRQKAQGALIGAVALGALGAVIGYQSYKDAVKKEQTKQLEMNASHLDMFGTASSEQAKPNLRPAQVRVRYVEDQIKDGTFIPAHFEYEISEPAHWQRSK